MLIIYPDTNALHANLLTLRPLSRKLVDGLLERQVEVVLSPVVVAEARRQTREAGEGTTREIRNCLGGVQRKRGVSTSAADAAIATLLEDVEHASALALAPLLESAACRILSWPRLDSEAMVTRELERRPRTRLKGNQTIGFRDTVIWYGLLELASWLDENDEILFVCADGGFLDAGVLAPLLMEELESAGFNPAQVRVASRLENAVVEVEERREILTQQESMILQAVIDHVAAFEGNTWASIDTAEDAPLKYGVEGGMGRRGRRDYDPKYGWDATDRR